MNYQCKNYSPTQFSPPYTVKKLPKEASIIVNFDFIVI